MLTMSSSGGKWLAGAIAAELPGCRYYDKEFFNPITNQKHERVLVRNFGSELISCYRNIALPGDERIDADIEETWGAENYTFTKECYSPFKLAVFKRHFTCFALLRRTEQCFPPLRFRVWSFYEHVWHALSEAGYAMTAETMKDRAMEAHRKCYNVIKHDALALNVPIIYFDDLQQDGVETLAGKIAACTRHAGSARKIAERLIATRQDQ